MDYTKDTIRLFWHHASKYPLYIIGLIIVIPLTMLAQQFLPPLITADILNRLSNGQFVQNDLWASFGPSLVTYGLLVALGTIVGWRIAIYLVWKLESKATRDISQRVFRHLMQQSADFHANNFGGSLVSQASKLTNAYVRFADTTTFQFYNLIIAFIFTTIFLLPRVPIYVVALLGFSLLYMVTAYFVTKQVRKHNRREAQAHSKQTGYLADSITNVMAVKSFASNQQEEKRFAEATEETRARAMDSMKLTLSKDTYFSAVTTAINVVSLIAAAGSVVLFQADIATVFLVMNYTANIIQRLWEFSNSTLRNYNRSFGDAADMVKILAIEPEIQDPKKPEKVAIANGAIHFDTVTFTHTGSKAALFKDLDIAIRPGEKIGLVGHSGSGKTTLTRLLLRFSDIDKGAITIDDQDIREITQNDLRAHIAYVPQEPNLFHRSIKENIAYGKPDATDEEIVEAARKAHAHEFIQDLANQYDTLVGERGVKLSGGQRQRIVIARAILKDAPILVLDEATSALDSESELLIQDALQELMKKRTAIVIAHRLSTIQKMDRIIVMDKGKIIEEGSHKSLLAHKGEYAKLWAHQSGGFLED